MRKNPAKSKSAITKGKSRTFPSFEQEQRDFVVSRPPTRFSREKKEKVLWFARQAIGHGAPGVDACRPCSAVSLLT